MAMEGGESDGGGDRAPFRPISLDVAGAAPGHYQPSASGVEAHFAAPFGGGGTASGWETQLGGWGAPAGAVPVDSAADDPFRPSAGAGTGLSAGQEMMPSDVGSHGHGGALAGGGGEGGTSVLFGGDGPGRVPGMAQARMAPPMGMHTAYFAFPMQFAPAASFAYGDVVPPVYAFPVGGGPRFPAPYFASYAGAQGPKGMFFPGIPGHTGVHALPGPYPPTGAPALPATSPLPFHPEAAGRWEGRAGDGECEEIAGWRSQEPFGAGHAASGAAGEARQALGEGGSERAPDRSKPRRPAQRRGRASRNKDKVCSSCGTRSSPTWRRGAGRVLLCNACGLWAKRRSSNSTARRKTRRKSPSGNSGTEAAPAESAAKKPRTREALLVAESPTEVTAAASPAVASDETRTPQSGNFDPLPSAGGAGRGDDVPARAGEAPEPATSRAPTDRT